MFLNIVCIAFMFYQVQYHILLNGVICKVMGILMCARGSIVSLNWVMHG